MSDKDFSSGIALRIAREGAQPDSLPVHPTRAAQLYALVELGPRPPWWRPFARRRWGRAFEAIVTTPRLSLAALTKAPSSHEFRYSCSVSTCDRGLGHDGPCMSGEHLIGFASKSVRP